MAGKAVPNLLLGGEFDKTKSVEMQVQATKSTKSIEKAHLVADFDKTKSGGGSPSNSTDSLDSEDREAEHKQLPEQVEETTKTKSKKPPSCVAKFCAKVVDHVAMMIFTTALTFYALTASDIKAIATEEPTDFAWMLMTILTFSVFSVEIIMTLIGKFSEYFGSFFFWLDCISTLTLLLDIDVIANWLFFGPWWRRWSRELALWQDCSCRRPCWPSGESSPFGQAVEALQSLLGGEAKARRGPQRQTCKTPRGG